MKIAIDIRKINDFGIGSHIWNLLKSLSDIDKENEYFLIGYDAKELPSLRDNFYFVKTTAGKYSLSEHFLLPLILKKIKCDIFHSPHYVTPIFYRGLTTVTIHDIIYLLFPSYLPLKQLRYYVYFQMKKSLKFSKIAFTVSESSKKDIIRFFPWAEKKIEVIYNGLDERFLGKANNELIEKFKRELGKYALYVGNIKPHKNIEILIRAMKKLKDKMKLVIAGGKPNEKILKEIKKEELEGTVIFKGFISLEELLALYEASFLFVFPSLYEGFGLPPLEAMAKGIPVISSSFSSMPEILKEGAIYFNPNSEESLIEALNTILNNEKLREEKILEGKKVAQNYIWSDSARKYLSWWRKIYENCPCP